MKNPHAQALGALTSERKKQTSAKNGRKGGYPFAPPLERLMAHAVKDGDCWLYNGRTDRPGQIRMGGQAHISYRASWLLHRGEIPPGMMVCHTCDRPGCFNPDHLFLGTHQDNMADREAKGRPTGTRHILASARTCCGDKRLVMVRRDGLPHHWEVRCGECDALLGTARPRN